MGGKGFDPKRELEKRGYKLVYVPHEVIADHIACYRVRYRGKDIYPPAADKLGIPLNEIWISELFRPYARYILFHELREIEYRARGYGVREAHMLALRDEREHFRGDPVWEELNREINIAPSERLLEVPGIGEVLSRRIMEHRPYRDIRELRRVPGIGPRRYELLSERFWCIVEGKEKG
ncbi:MAG: hypothetical protein GXO72_00050 [Caldiserica bacterium]|nr:hypothetical protein [Caldisericota bacterium]